MPTRKENYLLPFLASKRKRDKETQVPRPITAVGRRAQEGTKQGCLSAYAAQV